ncbi:MAG: 23S rRNA (guanosine(2251)-2'-O)-methyltransferase RlmB [bacterium]
MSAGRNNNSQWIYGIHAVVTLLKSRPGDIVEIRLLKGRRDQRVADIERRARDRGIAVGQEAKSFFNDLVELDGGGNHQGVAALTLASTDVYDESYLLRLIDDKVDPVVLILDSITDPHNLGACLRSADAAGVAAVVVPKDGSTGITPVVSKVACGAAETVPFVVVTNLARTMKAMQQKGFWIIGTAGEAQQSLYETSLTGPLALVMGAEGKGMRRLTRENCDLLVNLPMAGVVSSLNVSVATGVCLFEAVRQRSSTQKA